MLKNTAQPKKLLTAGIIVLFLMGLLFGITADPIVEAQIDPTAQQQTVEAMIAEMFAATQTAQADILTPTPTATPTPGMLTIAIQVPYPVGVSVEELRALLQEVVDNALARLPTMQPGSGDVLPAPAVISVTEPTPISPANTPVELMQWQYLLVYRCSGPSSLNYLEFYTTARISDALQTALRNHNVRGEAPARIMAVAGMEGWQITGAVGDVFGYYPQGESGPSCFPIMTFIRPTQLSAILPVQP